MHKWMLLVFSFPAEATEKMQVAMETNMNSETRKTPTWRKCASIKLDFAIKPLFYYTASVMVLVVYLLYSLKDVLLLYELVE